MSRVPSITSARLSPAVDRHTRQNRYLVTMTIRMVCFGLALAIPNPWRWVFAVGAIVLPYIAVVLANTGTSRVTRGVDDVVDLPELGPAPGGSDTDSDSDSDEPPGRAS